MNTSKQENLFDLDLISIKELTDVSDSLLNNNQTSEVKGKKYIIFMIADKHFAIASYKISEVVRPLKFTKLPNVPEWLLGIANLRGDIISIIDLQSLWNKTSIDSPKSKFIVLNTEEADSHIAFKVDKLREIAILPDEEIKTIDEDDLPYLFGKITHKSNLINLLDVEAILSKLTLN